MLLGPKPIRDNPVATPTTGLQPITTRHAMTFTFRRRALLGAGAAAAYSAALPVLAATQRAAQGSTTAKMPVLFLGHGSPMNAISDNQFTRAMQALGRELPKPRALLVVSAHWLTQGQTLVDTQLKPKTIHDFGGFPQALFDVQYPAPGHPELAQSAIVALSSSSGAKASQDWGLDHGTWSVLRLLYPLADVPTFQVSIDYHKPPRFHFAMGQALAALRTQGVLIIGSGNVVHNLRATDRSGRETAQASQPWAAQFDHYVQNALAQSDVEALLRPQLPDAVVSTAVPTPDHYFPLLYALGAAGTDAARTVHEGFQSGTLSMRSVQFG